MPNRGSIKVCKVIIDAQGNITNGSDMPSTTFTINWTGGAGLTPTIITSGYTPNEKIFTDSQGNDAYCVYYPNIPLANYGYSAEIIGSSGWETPKYNDQFNTKVLDLGDFYNYLAPGNENANGYMDLTNQAGPNRTLVLLNQYKSGNIMVTKYNDLNGNGVRDDNDPTMSGWQINLSDNPSQTTNADGNVKFTNLSSGTYSLSETMQSGWSQTGITCDGQNQELTSATEISGFPVSITTGQTVHCSIMNQQVAPALTITKTNDTGGADRSPGDTVLFTLTVTATQGAVNNVQVTDLPAGGFVYVPGSWTANSSTRGDIKNSPTTEPTYASPGVWNLGNMSAGETVTLTYLASIDGSEQSGLYKDLASAQGTSADGSIIQASAENPGYVSDTYVGTQVNVVRNDPGSIAMNVIQTGTVLGASTQLPSTGASVYWIVLASLLFIGGAGAMGTGIAINQKPMKKLKRRLHA
jgi:uncharacterized repeat protein (TIGR01451 family)